MNSFLQRAELKTQMDNISVTIRVRPLNSKEMGAGHSWLFDDKVLTQINPLNGKPVAAATYTFGTHLSATLTIHS